MDILITNFWFVTLKYYLVMCDPVLVIIIIIKLQIFSYTCLFTFFENIIILVGHFEHTALQGRMAGVHLKD